MSLTHDQALVCAKAFSDYFDKFNRIDDYIREQKLSSLSVRPFALPGMGPEEDLFSDFTMNPKDMQFEVVKMPSERWFIYLDMISSHNNMASPGRNMRLAVLEKTTGKWVGFIRLGSPVINMKPRNELLGCVVSNDNTTMNAFNKSAAMGFVIVPSQPFGFNYLGGKLLAGICCSHEVRYLLNSEYDMNTCLFETTSLYGSTKASSQYDGMKPYIRFSGLTDSDFLPMMYGKAYDDLKDFVEKIQGGPIVPEDASSRKLKIINAIVGLTKNGLKNNKNDYDRFVQTIQKAKDLTEQKRYYYSNYGFSNFKDVVTGKSDKLIADKENYDKFHLENIIEWWRKKATNRFETIKTEGRLRTEMEVWTGEKELDIIR